VEIGSCGKRPFLLQQRHRSADKRDRGYRHAGSGRRRPPEGYEETESTTTRRTAITLDHVQGRPVFRRFCRYAAGGHHHW